MKNRILITIIVINIFYFPLCYGQQKLGELIKFEDYIYSFEKLKKLELDSTWKDIIFEFKQKKVLFTNVNIFDGKNHSIMLIPTNQDNQTVEPIIYGKENAIKSQLGQWICAIDGVKIAIINIHSFDKNKISEFSSTCLWEEKTFTKTFDRNKENYQYSGVFWALSWTGNYYFGENPYLNVLDMTKKLKCNIRFKNGDIFFGMIDQTLNFVGQGEYKFANDDLFLNYKGFWANNKFDDSEKSFHQKRNLPESKLSLKNGNVITGDFSKGNIIPTQKYFIKYSNGDSYFGFLDIDFYRNGVGELKYNKNTEIFGIIGNWRKNELSGEAKIIYNDGSIIEGIWEKNKLIKIQENLLTYFWIPQEAAKKINNHHSQFENFELLKPEKQDFSNFTKKLYNKQLVEVIKIDEDKNLKNDLMQIRDERPGKLPNVFVIHSILNYPGVHYTANIESDKSHNLLIRFSEKHSNKLYDYTVHGTSANSKITKNGNYNGKWKIKTNFGIEYELEYRDNDIIAIQIKSNRINFAANQKIHNAVKTYQGTYKEISKDLKHDTLIYQAIWDKLDGVKISRGIHILNQDTLYIGFYDNDFRSGYGIGLLKNKEFIKYEGNWCNNKIRGKGKMISKSHQCIVGYWNDTKEIKIPKLLNQKTDINIPSFSKNLCKVQLDGNSIEIIDKVIENRALSPSINLLNTSAIQKPNGVVSAAVKIPRKTGVISFNDVECDHISYNVLWSDGNSGKLFLNDNLKITKVLME